MRSRERLVAGVGFEGDKRARGLTITRRMTKLKSKAVYRLSESKYSSWGEI